MQCGGGLSALPFNLALHKVMQNLYTNGNICFRLTQDHAYADDIDLVAR